MTELATLYSRDFYDGQSPTSFDSGAAMLPPITALLRPRSLLDVGCGVGTWLAAAEQLGVSRVVGIEGPWVNASQLKSSRIELVTHDLERPLPIQERFDLAMCVEVAEHLSLARADGFVAELCARAPAVLFGAAIPGQGGVNHLNEQWQSTWAARFASHGYRVVDLLRPAFWMRREILTHYRQNTLLYVHESLWSELEARHGGPLPVPQILDVVHPEVLGANVDALNAQPTIGMSLKSALDLPAAVLRSLRKRLS